MTTTIPIISSPNPSILKLRIHSLSPHTIRPHNYANSICTKIPSLSTKQVYNFPGFSGKTIGSLPGRSLRAHVSDKNDGADDGEEEEAEDEDVGGGESTMPGRFRYLATEAPDPPLRWPWFVALAFLIYAWRAVLLELSNWAKAPLAVVHFVGHLLKLIFIKGPLAVVHFVGNLLQRTFALILHFIGDPIISTIGFIETTIRFIETTIYAVRAYYSGIVAYTPVPELTMAIMLASSVLAIAEAVVPNSLNCQPFLLTLAGLVGYAAVSSVISEPFFWTILVGLYGYSRFVKKRDNVTSALPSAAVLAAVGEPWIRVLVIPSYLALAIFHHWKKLPETEEEVVVTNRKVPLPLLGAALAIGIRLAAKWAGYRHLTWKIV